MSGTKLFLSRVLMLMGILAGVDFALGQDLSVTNTPAVTNVTTAPVVLEPVTVTNAPSHPIVTEVTPVTNTVVMPVVTPVPVATNTVVLPPVTNVSVEVAEMSEGEVWQAASWQVGTRITQFKLQDKTRGTPGNGSYFGTITEISEEQDNAPDKVYLQYRLMKSPVWLGLSYDHIRAITMDDGNGDGIPDKSGGDGTEDLQGIIPYVQAAWNNSSRFTPFAQVGYGFYKAKFEPNSWGDDGRRGIDAKKNVHGVEMAGGLSVRVYKSLSAELFTKYVKVDDITGEWFYNYGQHGGPFVMTMSYVAYGAGLNLRF